MFDAKASNNYYSYNAYFYRFPKEYGYALRQLVQVNIYPMDLISFVMGPEYKKLAYGKDPLKVGIENFILDQSLRIEYPYYKGPQLNNDICKYMSNVRIYKI